MSHGFAAYFEVTMLDEVSGGKDPKAETCCRIQIVCDCALAANQTSGRPVPDGNDYPIAGKL